MDSTLQEIQFVTPKNKYTIFYYNIPVSFGPPYVCCYSNVEAGSLVAHFMKLVQVSD